MVNPIDKLKGKLFKSKDDPTKSGLTDIYDVIRTLGCFGEIMGRTFEVYSNDGALLYTIKQKPITIKQLNIAMNEVGNLKNNDAKLEAKKFKMK